MLKRSLAIALVIVVGAMAESPIAAAPGDFLIVRGDVVNVRAGPSTGYRVRMRVLLEQLVIERRREGDWIEVRIAGNGGEGWIHGSLLTKIRPTLGGGPRPAEPLMPAKVEIAETTAPIGRPVGGPLEAWAEPDLGGGSAAIERPSVAIASEGADTDLGRAAPIVPSHQTFAALPLVASAAASEAMSPGGDPSTQTAAGAKMGPDPDPISAAGQQPAATATIVVAPTAVTALLSTTVAPASTEPAAPVDPALERFRVSVTYLNIRAVGSTGVDLFTGVQAVGSRTVRVHTTDAWKAIPPAGRETYLRTLIDRWAASRGTAGPGQVQIIDSNGHVVVERGRP